MGKRPGHWHACGSDAGEARRWFEAGWADPAVTVRWHLRGFAVEEALDRHGRAYDPARVKRERDRRAAVAR